MLWIIGLWLFSGQLLWNYGIWRNVNIKEAPITLGDAIITIVLCWLYGPVGWWLVFRKV